MWVLLSPPILEQLKIFCGRQKSILRYTQNMSKAGRPKTPKEEKFIARSVRFHPRLWEEFSAMVPAGERSAMIRRLLERELKKRRRQAAKASPSAALASAPAGSATSSTGEESWRLAAMAAKEYYDTDPEAVEWAMFAGDTLDE